MEFVACGVHYTSIKSLVAMDRDEKHEYNTEQK
jgi:hypothetical protein